MTDVRDRQEKHSSDADALRHLASAAADPDADLAPAAALDLVARCEAAGLVHAASEVCRQALGRHPEHTELLRAAAALLEELGDGRGSSALRRRADELEHPPAPVEDDDATAGTQDLERALRHADPTDLARFVELFAGREGVHARQWADRERDRGGYSPVREPLTAALAADHLASRLTLGSYLVRVDDTVRHVVLDLDVRREALDECRGNRDRFDEVQQALREEGPKIGGALGQLGIPHLFADSGHKGRHWWILLDDPVEARHGFALGVELARTLAPLSPDLRLEAFPKQASVAPGGLGNLVKLPLGQHRVSGRRAWILHADGSLHPRPLRALSRWKRLEAARLPALLAELASRPSRPTDIRDAKVSAGPGTAFAAHVETPVPPPFEEKDLHENPEIAALLDGCGVLQRVVERILAEGMANHDMVVVLQNTLGHLEVGPRAVNFLLDRCAGIPASARMGRVNRGSAASCARVRERLSGIARRVGCGCEFQPRHLRTTYRSPLWHAVEPGRAVRVEDEPAPPKTTQPGDPPSAGEAVVPGARVELERGR